MSQSDNAQKYEYLSAMTTEQLRELLRLEIESDHDHDELVLHILEVINRRKKDENHQQITWQQARADFDRYYNTPDGKGRQLYPMDAGREEKPAKRKHGTVIRWVATVAAVLAIVLLTVPPALGYSDVWDMVARWTEDVLQMKHTSEHQITLPDSVEDYVDFSSFQEVLNKCNVNVQLSPNWFPPDYLFETASIRVRPSRNEKILTGVYQKSPDDSIIVQIIQRNTHSTRTYEKDVDFIEMYEAGGVCHWVYSNNGGVAALWHNENYECTISADIPIDQLKQMIDSIYEKG